MVWSQRYQPEQCILVIFVFVIFHLLLYHNRSKFHSLTKVHILSHRHKAPKQLSKWIFQRTVVSAFWIFFLILCDKIVVNQILIKSFTCVFITVVCLNQFNRRLDGKIRPRKIPLAKFFDQQNLPTEPNIYDSCMLRMCPIDSYIKPTISWLRDHTIST